MEITKKLPVKTKGQTNVTGNLIEEFSIVLSECNEHSK